ncbi:NADH-quinone oxidoreductase subunit C [Streptomyces sp. JJ66]|uniref:NADH-quinone oxidoreductase subunit C n=1 Tax=Streptomyces sp. JJ66 TaxID=2803843 RepID=UPI001C589A53|nr:NADH-quinone oxidoreductase subunit C [Streptomyces sp. JJ66]
MSAVGWLPRPAEELFGEGACAQEAYGLLTVDVPAAAWVDALRTARDELGCTYFDWLSAVDEPGTGFLVCAHVAALPGTGGVAGTAPGADPDGAAGGGVRRLVLRTTVPHDAPALPTATGVYAGAAWHERETHEMFGVGFPGHPGLTPLLLPDSFEGHPLRKDFVLAARVAKAWPGAKEPGESEHGGPKRRQMLPPGVPDPNEWGPLKGQLPPAPARPARGRAAASGDRPARPARRTRSAAAGSASQRAAAPPAPAAPPEGGAGEGTQAPTPNAQTPPEPPPETPPTGTPSARPRRRTASDAPWGEQPGERAPQPPAPGQGQDRTPSDDTPSDDTAIRRDDDTGEGRP